MKRINLILLCFMIPVLALAQGSNNPIFSPFNLSLSPRIGALGSHVSSLPVEDINIASSNLSLLTSNMDKHFAINYGSYFSAYSHSALSYSQDFNRLGTFLTSIQYVDYGKVDEYDESGNYLGRSSSSYDLIFNLGWGKQLDSNFSIGANFKYLHSNLDNFKMNGIAVDLSASYINRNKDFSASLIVRNIGTMLSDNIFNEYQNLPFEIMAAVSKRLEHAPFRFTLVLSNLQKWNLSGVDVNEVTINELTQEEEKVNKFNAFADNLMRHIVPGVEFLPAKNVSLRIGYNYHRRQELKTSGYERMVGFSWGVGLKIYKFNIDYARMTYHLAGAPNLISVSSKLSDWF